MQVSDLRRCAVMHESLALDDLAEHRGTGATFGYPNGHSTGVPQSKGVTMTTKETTRAEVVALLDHYAPPEVRASWAELADELEEKGPGIADLIGRLQAAWAQEDLATLRLYVERDVDLTDEVDDGLRLASGWKRLVDAVNASELWEAVESRFRTPEERELVERAIAKSKARKEVAR